MPQQLLHGTNMITNNSTFGTIHKETELELFTNIINKHLEDCGVPTIINVKYQDCSNIILTMSGPHEDTIKFDINTDLPNILELCIGETEE